MSPKSCTRKSLKQFYVKFTEGTLEKLSNLLISNKNNFNVHTFVLAYTTVQMVTTLATFFLLHQITPFCKISKKGKALIFCPFLISNIFYIQANFQMSLIKTYYTPFSNSSMLSKVWVFIYSLSERS